MRCWVEVSLARIAENYHAVRAVVGTGVEVMAVVKADAYRHGAIEVSRALEREGAPWLAVSNVEEGVALRQAGIEARILVTADYVAAGREAWAEYRLTPAIHALEELRELDKRVAYHLKVDTGMGRLGTSASPVEIAAAIRAVGQERCEGLMTHFASSADYSTPQTDDQLRVFQTLVEELLRAGIAPRYLHTASTNPITFGRREAWGNLVRPGYAIYGYVSAGRDAPPRVLDVKPALSWKARIVAVKDVPEGALIGYGGMYRASRAMRIAVVGAGYADGLPHRLSNRGKVIAGGRLASILGAVSMDVTTIDVSHAPWLKSGDVVTLLGSEGDVSLDAQQIARMAGTISYSVLCGISARVKRVFV